MLLTPPELKPNGNSEPRTEPAAMAWMVTSPAVTLTGVAAPAATAAT
jgi:hypothetical protein